MLEMIVGALVALVGVVVGGAMQASKKNEKEPV